MRDKHILFSAPMVRALLGGRKTQTRRMLKPQPPADEYGDPFSGYLYGPEWYKPEVVGRNGDSSPGKPIFGVYDELGEWGTCVPYAPGDRLWVREAWSGEHDLRDIRPSERPELSQTWYWADGNPEYGDWERPRPSIHMPRWASRLTLVVADVRVQRLQEITLGDICAEGLESSIYDFKPVQRGVDGFRDLWDSLNAKRTGCSWADNPWVCAISFTVHRCNIDQMGALHD